MKRKLLGILIAPLIIPITAFFFAASRCGIAEPFGSDCFTRAGIAVWVSGLFGIPFGWIVLAVFSMPLLWLASKVVKLNTVNVTIIGALLGAFLMTVLSFATFFQHPQMLYYYTRLGFIYGGVVALLYWKIAYKSYT